MPVKKIVDFSVEYLQVLDEKGRVDTALEPKIGKAKLLRLYRGMLLARRLDERMLKLQRQGRIGTFAPCTGQEAAHCPIPLVLTDRDWFISAFRETGARLMLGETLTQVMHYYNGWEEGAALPEGYKHLMPINIIVGSQIPQAAGVGYALKLKGEGAAAVSFIGDGGTSEGDFHEGLNFAGVWKAPVVFIIQNNQWAISTPRKRQTAAETLAQKAIAHGMPGVQVDGNDPLAVYVAASEALERARNGEGPTLIEAVTYRLMMHTTADDPTKYRSREEEDEWWKKDPMVRFRKYLLAKKVLTDAADKKVEKEVAAEIEAAVKEFESAEAFKPDAPFDNVFGTRHPLIEEQRADFLKNLSEDGKDAQD